MTAGRELEQQMKRKKGGRNRVRGKVSFEDEKAKSDTKDDAKVIQATKSAGNPANDEGVQDETVATSTKRNRRSAKDKKKASEITEYNDNVVGRRIRVYLPREFKWSEAVIESYDPGLSMHLILHDDDKFKETVELEDQVWKFIEDQVSSEVQPSEPADQDGASEMPKKKKAKATTSEKISRAWEDTRVFF